MSNLNIDLCSDYEEGIVNISISIYPNVKIQLTRIEMLDLISAMAKSLIMLDNPIMIPYPLTPVTITLRQCNYNENEEQIIPNEDLGWKQINDEE